MVTVAYLRILLTQHIEDSFSAKKKARAVFVDLTAAYTVWHRGFTCKLLQLLPDRYMVHMKMQLVGNCNFTLTTGNNTSRMASHRHPSWHPFVSTSTPDLPTIISRKNMTMIWQSCMLMETGKQWKEC